VWDRRVSEREREREREMAGIGPIRQDWEPVVVRKKAPTAAAKKDEKAVNAARRSGAEIETMKKCKRPSILARVSFSLVDLCVGLSRFVPFCPMSGW
jgi:hypothetical protein